MFKKTLLCAVAIALLSATACNKASTDSADLATAFALGQMATATNDSGTSHVQFGNGHTATAETGTISARSTPSPLTYAHSAVVSIVDAAGTTVYSLKPIRLLNMGSDAFLSEAIALPPGAYTLTQFVITDVDGNALFATPIEGSQLAYLVADPLPVSFSVTKDHVTNVTPEVLAVSGNPGDFGYATFAFKIVDTISFLIAAISQDATGKTGLTSADVHIQAWTPGQSRSAIQQVTIPAATTLLTVPAGYDRYAFVLIHPGDDGLPMLCSIRPANAATPLTSIDLKAFSATPLTFQLTGDDCSF